MPWGCTPWVWTVVIMTNIALYCILYAVAYLCCGMRFLSKRDRRRLRAAQYEPTWASVPMMVGDEEIDKGNGLGDEENRLGNEELGDEGKGISGIYSLNTL